MLFRIYVRPIDLAILSKLCDYLDGSVSDLIECKKRKPGITISCHARFLIDFLFSPKAICFAPSFRTVRKDISSGFVFKVVESGRFDLLTGRGRIILWPIRF